MSFAPLRRAISGLLHIAATNVRPTNAFECINRRSHARSAAHAARDHAVSASPDS
jgi:hypothetical protein